MSGKRGPESGAWDELKGRQVVLTWWREDRMPDCGVLRWVDRYTVGILFPGDRHVTLVMKGALVAVKRA